MTVSMQPRGTGTGGGAVLALFAIVCGLVLLFAGGRGCESGRGPGLARAVLEKQEAARRQAEEVQKTVQAAESSIEGANYGAARQQLQAVRQNTAVMLFQLDEIRKLAEGAADQRRKERQ